MELKRLVDDEDADKKKRKSIALKDTNIKDMEDEDCESEINKYMKLMCSKI